MTEVSTALQNIRKGDGTDTQPILHLVELVKSRDTTEQHVPQLLTQSPSCSEVFAWWDRGSGQHVQSAACFTLFAALNKSVITTHTQFEVQAIAISRKVIKERLHSVYSCLSKYSSIPARKHCLDFLILLNCFGSSVTKTLLEDFNFGNVSLKQMLANPGAVHEDAVRFMLSFLCVPSIELKVKFMSMKNVFKSMAMLIERDSLGLKVELLKVLLDHVLNDTTKIQKRVKCQFFAVPVLVNISKFWGSESTELREQTDLFFRALFHRKTGILFDSSASDVFTETSRNPLLLSFVKHASTNSIHFSVFLVDMVKVCPEVCSSLIGSITTKKSSDSTFVSDLCKVLQARDVSSLLSTVSSDISERQIMDYLVPTSIRDLLEKRLKGSEEVDPAMYHVLLALAESAATAVEMLKGRELLKDIAIFNFVELSIIHNAGLLTSKLAGTLTRIDLFCLHQYRLESIIDTDSKLSDDDVDLLILTYPNALKKIVKAHHKAVVDGVLEKTERSRMLFEKILSAIYNDSYHDKSVKVLTSIVFDDHYWIMEEKVTEEMVAEEMVTEEMVTEEFDFNINLKNEVLLFVHRITDFSDNFGPEFLASVSNGLCNGQSIETSTFTCISTLLEYIINPNSTVAASLDYRVFVQNYPVFFIGAMLSCDAGWGDLPPDLHDDIRKSIVSVENFCLAFEHSASLYGKLKPLQPFYYFSRIFDDDLLASMKMDPKGYEGVTTILPRIVDALLERKYKFIEVEVMRCIIMKEWLTDKRVESVVLNVLISEDPDDRKDEDLLYIIQNHLDKFKEFCGSRDYLPVNSIYFGLFHFFDLFLDSPDKLDKYHIIWFLYFLGDSHTFCNDLFSYMPQCQLEKLYTALCHESYLEILPGCGSVACKHARFQCLLMLEELLNSQYTTEYDYIFATDQYREHKKEYTSKEIDSEDETNPDEKDAEDETNSEEKDTEERYSEDDYVSELLQRKCILPKLLCKTLPQCKSDACFLVNEALTLVTTDFFVSGHFDLVAKLSECMKSKKVLKQIFELFTQKMELKQFRVFLSQYVTVYEENLPVFTRKQVDNSMSSTVQSLNSAFADDISATTLGDNIEMLTLLIATFQDILVGEGLSAMFGTFAAHPTVQKILLSDEHKSDKTLLTKLFVFLLESGKIPKAILTKTHYLLFQAAYTASTSDGDKNVLKILKHFESNGIVSKYPFAYGSYVEELKTIKNITLYNEHCIKVLENIDTELIYNLIDNFPLHSDQSQKHVDSGTASTVSCDPEFILSLLYHVLYSGEVEVRMVLSQPISKVVLLATSSYDEPTRRVAYACIEKITRMIEEEKFKEKSMCSYLFKMLENSIISDDERLPHLSMYFLGRILHALFTPGKQIYSNICHFLLQRPIFDFHDVPMFYSMFCSSSLHYKQDQNWLLEILCVAVRDEVDYKILTRRHVLPYCFSQLFCPNLDKYTVKLLKRLFTKVFAIKSTTVQKDLAEQGITEISASIHEI